MKKVLLFLLSAISLMSLVACGGGGSSSTPASTNNPPTSSAGADAAASTCSSVSLSGSGSDADGNALTYAWTLTAPAGSLSTLVNSTLATPSFTPDVAGAYTASLVVNDGTVNSAADSVIVTATQPALSVSFQTDLQAVFTSSCTSCHTASGSGYFMSLLSGNSYGNLVSVMSTVTNTSEYRVKRCDSASSALYQRVSGVGLPAGEVTMPQGGSLLSPATITKFRTWIDGGAPNN